MVVYFISRARSEAGASWWENLPMPTQWSTWMSKPETRLKNTSLCRRSGQLYDTITVPSISSDTHTQMHQIPPDIYDRYLKISSYNPWLLTYITLLKVKSNKKASTMQIVYALDLLHSFNKWWWSKQRLAMLQYFIHGTNNNTQA